MYKEKYQYTFISALRNKLNHGGELEKTTTLGGAWSIKYEYIESDALGLSSRKDKKYSIFD